MNVLSTITIVVIISVCVLPFVLYVIHTKKTKEKRIAALKNLAASQNAIISTHDFTSAISIGMDEDKKLVFLLRKIDGNETSYYQNMAEVTQCRTECKYNSDNGVKSISHLSLVFSIKGPVNRTKKWVLFDIEEDLQLENEFNLAEKWSQQINSMLKSPVNAVKHEQLIMA